MKIELIRKALPLDVIRDSIVKEYTKNKILLVRREIFEAHPALDEFAFNFDNRISLDMCRLIGMSMALLEQAAQNRVSVECLTLKNYSTLPIEKLFRFIETRFIRKRESKQHLVYLEREPLQVFLDEKPGHTLVYVRFGYDLLSNLMEQVVADRMLGGE